MVNMNKEFEQKWYSSDIQSIMGKVASRYMTAIEEDDIESIKMDTLWHCLKKYDEGRGTKFTSYLYQQLTFAMKNALKKKRREFTSEHFDKEDHTPIINNQVIDIVSGLDDEDSNILKQRFYDNLTIKEIGNENGYSRETARRKLQNALKNCKMLYN
jgi:RNA polymerase sigma factor (sigma-70 family)